MQLQQTELVLLNLNKEQIQKPELVLDHLLECYDLNEVREALWTWLKAALASKEGYSEPIDRSNLMFLYERILKLIEAAWLIQAKKNY